MKITLPDYFLGKPVKGALERVLSGNAVPPVPPTSTASAGFTPTPANITNPEQYIILPAKNYGKYSYAETLISMERRHKGKNWFNVHAELANTGFYMPTVRQFVDFLALLRSGNVLNGNGQKIPQPRVTELLEDITAVRDPYRAEWLDADFKVLNGTLHMHYGHHFKTPGKLEPQYTEPLVSCLMQDKKPGLDLADWIGRATPQGLPPADVRLDTSKKGIWYWRPLSDNNSVAGFSAYSDGADLGCYWDPSGTLAGLGVRAARKKI